MIWTFFNNKFVIFFIVIIFLNFEGNYF